MRINVDVGKLYVARCVLKEFSMDSFCFPGEVSCWLICKVRWTRVRLGTAKSGEVLE